MGFTFKTVFTCDNCGKSQSQEVFGRHYTLPDGWCEVQIETQVSEVAFVGCSTECARVGVANLAAAAFVEKPE